MSELVEKLSKGQHSVSVSIRPERNIKALKECLDRGFVHVKFTETLGGTELGIPIDPQRSELASGDFERATGAVTLVGTLTLDYVRVRCTAKIDLESLDGLGSLEIITE